MGFNVVAKRIENLEPLEADVLSARALAPLGALLGYSEQHLKKGGTALFAKGETWRNEVEDASKSWRFSLKSHKSRTNPNAAILEIGDLSRA